MSPRDPAPSSRMNRGCEVRLAIMGARAVPNSSVVTSKLLAGGCCGFVDYTKTAMLPRIQGRRHRCKIRLHPSGPAPILHPSAVNARTATPDGYAPRVASLVLQMAFRHASYGLTDCARKGNKNAEKREAPLTPWGSLHSLRSLSGLARGPCHAGNVLCKSEDALFLRNRLDCQPLVPSPLPLTHWGRPKLWLEEQSDCKRCRGCSTAGNY